MEYIELEELRRRRRDQIVRLMEVQDLTEQLRQAVERRDQVSVRVLLSMREPPIRQLQEIEEGIQSYLLTLPEEDAIRGGALLNGAPPETSEEEALSEQQMIYRRALEKTVAADRRVSEGLGGKRSFYKKYLTKEL